MDELNRIPDLAGFDWDRANIEKNWLKHNVSPFEAEQIFFNQPLVLADDAVHSKREKRYYVLGRTDAGRTLFAAFTVRKNLIRIISVRDMSKKERKLYEKATEANSEVR